MLILRQMLHQRHDTEDRAAVKITETLFCPLLSKGKDLCSFSTHKTNGNDNVKIILVDFLFHVAYGF